LKSSELRKQFGNQRPQIFDSVRSCDEHRHRERQGTEILLILEILVCCDKNVELACGKAEKLAVLNCRPTHFGNGFDGMAGKFAA